MRNIRLIIEYDGSKYHGWQLQKNTHHTLQEIIEKILRRILQEKVRIIASGRTDAGVSAVGQVVNFKTKTTIPTRKLKSALNSLLPEDIVITKVKDVDSTFHAQFNAKSKIYRYTILNQRHPSVFLRNFTYFFPYKLDVKLMRSAARFLLGRHDFACFQASPVRNTNSHNGVEVSNGASPVRNTNSHSRTKISNGASDKKASNSIRTIKMIRLSREGNLILIDIEANGFLYKMVRNIVGTLIEIGEKKQPPISIKKILTSRNRRFAGPTVPGHGLCLLRVKY